ncbi:RdgB/HAM1 family non-canonical purine NTP pyrophosphatase [Tissierella sp.]|uniref:RdgB/HAM1 family non-canonical purine NTP pyrophosphatase n=1 Tax=Tissierella sp. TaxID=41274 RepID=UPI00285C5A63|nr:RdgB/HAM1 family non-canonical purine NTP pyrophosphatase [Tissierella sp.]MDR7856686.1 RdgB/HAM1 family non-canonical purine NTP pyrophosphatase [Tissierella sp.]
MKNRKLVISTGNLDKVKEIREILKDLPIEVVSKKDIGLGHIDVLEDGNTLEENSIKKAKALSEQTNYIVLADDSGLFVDVLNGQPGVYSSRYAGEEGNNEKNNIKLLEELKDFPLEQRNASFKTVIALITEEKDIMTVYGECKGTIGFELRGNKGFGYDPLFKPEGFHNTFGELGDNIKNKISHRAKALENLKIELIKLLEDK